MQHTIITFWFEEIEKSKWFTKDNTFDALIRLRFENIHHQAAQSELYHWRDNALGSLAEIIVLDQFSRNMFRDTPQSFAYDALALALAQFAISNGLDKNLTPVQRSFMYMPFMHSESLAIHDEAVRLYNQLGIESNLEFELKHRAIIERFGRYPHRNNLLGRKSTPEEVAFLKLPGSGF